MRTAVHRVSLEPRKWHAIQDDSDLSDVRKNQECLPDVLVGLGVWVADAGQRHGFGVAKRGPDQ